MSKPDWKDAPKWANWVALNASGEWAWFEFEPVCTLGAWSSIDGQQQRASVECRPQLEPRP